MAEVIFDIKKMEKLRRQDKLIGFMYMNLNGLSNAKKLEILFNSEVLNDSVMMEVYKKL